MSRTKDDNKEIQAAFMDVWGNGEVTTEGELETIQASILDCVKAITATEKEFAPQIKQAKGLIVDAETRIDDITGPLEEIILIGDRMAGIYLNNKLSAEAKINADKVVAARTDAIIEKVVDTFEAVVGKPKRKKKGVK
jgi:hypothetical protein